MVTPNPDIRIGDLLCYRPSGAIGWLIASRTWSQWAHVEVYWGHGRSLASRDLRGVSMWPYRSAGLGRVLRPKVSLDLLDMWDWFGGVNGQKYDLWAIVRFMLPHVIKCDVDLTRQICSAFAVRLYRAGGFDPVAPDADADLVAPSNLVQSPAFTTVWSDGKP